MSNTVGPVVIDEDSCCSTSSPSKNMLCTSPLSMEVDSSIGVVTPPRLKSALFTDSTLKSLAVKQNDGEMKSPSDSDRVYSETTTSTNSDKIHRRFATFSRFTDRCSDKLTPLRRRFIRSYSDDIRRAADPDPVDGSDSGYSLTPTVRNLWGRSLTRHRRIVVRRRVGSRPKRGRDDYNYWRLRRKQRWLIPAQHPLKLFWDIMTVILSFLNAYATHTSIRDRQFGNNLLIRFCELWFLIDILLNFVTEYKTGEGTILKEPTRVWARYLTTWFVVDALSLFPGEVLYIKPIIEMQNKRSFFQKSFFRTKAVIRVTRVLRGRHFRIFSMVAKYTKSIGIGAVHLLHLIIRYVPKYLMFLRNMKAVIVMRLLRQIHWIRKVWLQWRCKDEPVKHRAFYFRRYVDDDDDDETRSMSDVDELYSLDNVSDGHIGHWEYFEDDDDDDDEYIRSHSYEDDDPF